MIDIVTAHGAQIVWDNHDSYSEQFQHRVKYLLDNLLERFFNETGYAVKAVVSAAELDYYFMVDLSINSADMVLHFADASAIQVWTANLFTDQIYHVMIREFEAAVRKLLYEKEWTYLETISLFKPMSRDKFEQFCIVRHFQDLLGTPNLEEVQ